jgi:hypothetical protein
MFVGGCGCVVVVCFVFFGVVGGFFCFLGGWWVGCWLLLCWFCGGLV